MVELWFAGWSSFLFVFVLRTFACACVALKRLAVCAVIVLCSAGFHVVERAQAQKASKDVRGRCTGARSNRNPTCHFAERASVQSATGF